MIPTVQRNDITMLNILEDFYLLALKISFHMIRQVKWYWLLYLASMALRIRAKPNQEERHTDPLLRTVLWLNYVIILGSLESDESKLILKENYLKKI